MNKTIQTQSHQDVGDRYVESVMQDLQQRGYGVTLNPASEDLPFDLGHYHPDLVAFKDGGGLVIEVRKSAARLSVDRLQTIAETIAAHDGWQFRLLTPKDIPGYEVDGHTKFPSWSMLQSKAQEVETLVKHGMKEPALLYLWSILEASLRKRAIAQHLPIDGYESRNLLKHMYSSGEVSMNEFDLFNSLYPLRNKTAHGIEATVDLDILKEVLKVMRLLINQWNEDTA